MILENTRFGSIEVNEDKIVTLIRSMPGFPGRRRFVLLNRKESLPFLWFQCVDDPSLAFVLIDPFLFMPEYEIDLEKAVEAFSWGATDRKDVAVFVIVNTTQGGPEKMTANLMAPLLLNTHRREGCQVIFQDSIYSHRHPIFGATHSN